MVPQVIEVIEACSVAARRGTSRFPEIVKRLGEVGVGQYHADFVRAENTYYLRGGESHVAGLELPDEAIAEEFKAEDVAAAVRASQLEGILYSEFLSRAMRAGCCGYFVYIEGRRVVYLGSKGDIHVEYFPGQNA